MKLIIERSMLEHIIAQAHAGRPNEICGLLGGRGEHAEALVAVPNVASTPRVRFMMDRRLMVETILDFQQHGQDVVAIYHSHPDGSGQLSQTDVAEATWPDAAYIVIGLADPERPDIGVWQVLYGQARPVELIVLG